MKNSYIYILIFAFFAGCSSGEKAQTEENVVAKAGDKTLTYKDLQSFANAFSGDKDSAEIVAEYVKKWAATEALYLKAEKNFKADAKIEKLVDDYRKMLIINRFKQKIIDDNQKLPTDEQIAEYYRRHSAALKLDEPIVRGAFLKIPKNAPQKEQLKKDLRKLTQESIEKIEKYSLKHIANYEIFTENWKKYSAIAEKLPLPAANKDGFVSAAKFYEMSDSTSVYYLSITEYKTTSEEMPLEFVKDLIVNILIEKNNLQFLKDYTQKLYENGVKKGDIIVK